jgi:hypothetical protein
MFILHRGEKLRFFSIIGIAIPENSIFPRAGCGVRGGNLIPDDSCPGHRITRSLSQVLPNPLLCGSLIVCFHIISKGALSPEIHARHGFLIAHGIYVHFFDFASVDELKLAFCI